jgi:hypothetical protein
VFPDTYHLPTGSDEGLVGPPVARHVAVELPAPPVGIGRGLRRMVRTRVPEAAVDVDGNVSRTKNDVRGAADRRHRSTSNPKAEPSSVQFTTERDFWPGVARRLARHATADRVRRRFGRSPAVFELCHTPAVWLTSNDCVWCDGGHSLATERHQVVNTPIEDERFEQFCQDADAKTPARAAAELRRYGVPDPIVDELVERYEQYVGIVKDVRTPHYMESGGRITWYGGPRPTDPCWPKLVDKLRKQNFEDDAVTKLDEATTRIVSLLEHPATVDFATKGLVLGHVQSGKTTNYTGVVAKAADRGYRLVIVLAGIHNELRRQTQNRLISQLVDPNPELWHQLTDPNKDFHPTANAPAYFAKYSKQKVLCVVKKNAVVLRKLIAWLEEASQQLGSIPALVIDDEADQAAVATKTINPLILQLLDVLPRVAYVGYTATPFANLLIDPAAENLYPEHFIVDLPKPDAHFGTESIFGREPLDGEDPADYDDGALDMVRTVPDAEVVMVRPSSKDEVNGFSPQVRGELRRSILYFWLATAARRHRGSGVPHSTMLIHTSVRVAVHESFKPPIEALRQRLVTGIDTAEPELRRELESIWHNEVPRVSAAQFGEAAVQFPDLWSRLPEVVASSRVILDNSRSEDRLDYSGDPVTAIAVGGNTLSRGLTLEGLVVSYFVRAATAYDTLLQMGRWFGYRAGYADLPRIWMTEELQEWFRHLAGVEAEIRRDIDRYMQDDETPKTFAVRIRKHPSLAITAAAKMKDAVTASAAYGGLRIQTRYFKADDPDWLGVNAGAAQSLVSRMESLGTHSPLDAGHLWREVDVDHVLHFLDAYLVHPKAPDNDTRLIAGYVRKRADRGQLLRWNVALIGSARAGRGEHDFTPSTSVPRVIRSRLEKSPRHAADIKTLMSRRDAAVDLEVPPGTVLTEGEILAMRRTQAPETPLLTLYAIDSVSPTVRENRVPLDAAEDAIGVGIVFPKPEDDDDDVYVSADLSGVAEASDGYLEEEDLSALEEEQV